MWSCGWRTRKAGTHKKMSVCCWPQKQCQFTCWCFTHTRYLGTKLCRGPLNPYWLEVGLVLISYLVEKPRNWDEKSRSDLGRDTLQDVARSSELLLLNMCPLVFSMNPPTFFSLGIRDIPSSIHDQVGVYVCRYIQCTVPNVLYFKYLISSSLGITLVR